MKNSLKEKIIEAERFMPGIEEKLKPTYSEDSMDWGSHHYQFSEEEPTDINWIETPTYKVLAVNLKEFAHRYNKNDEDKTRNWELEETKRRLELYFQRKDDPDKRLFHIFVDKPLTISKILYREKDEERISNPKDDKDDVFLKARTEKKIIIAYGNKIDHVHLRRINLDTEIQKCITNMKQHPWLYRNAYPTEKDIEFKKSIAKYLERSSDRARKNIIGISAIGRERRRGLRRKGPYSYLM